MTAPQLQIVALIYHNVAKDHRKCLYVNVTQGIQVPALRHMSPKRSQRVVYMASRALTCMVHVTVTLVPLYVTCLRVLDLSCSTSDAHGQSWLTVHGTCYRDTCATTCPPRLIKGARHIQYISVLIEKNM